MNLGLILAALWLVGMLGVVGAAFWEFDQRTKGKR